MVSGLIRKRIVSVCVAMISATAFGGGDSGASHSPLSQPPQKRRRIVSDAVYYKVPQLRFADSNVHASGGSRTHALDSYYHGLEDERCKAKGGVASFFTDPL